MDNGNGTFVSPEPHHHDISIDDLLALKKGLEDVYPKHGAWFQVGQIVILNGSTFRVKAVKPNELRLKLLPKT